MKTDRSEATKASEASTPRPWEFDEQLPKQTGKGGEEVFKVCARSGGLIADVSAWWVDRDSARANARLIVSAVNQYDAVAELITAAREAEASLVLADILYAKDVSKRDRNDAIGEIRNGLRALRSALAAFEKGNPE